MMAHLITLERLRGEGETLMQEVSREYYEAHAGLKPTADLQRIYERHADILGDEAMALVLEDFRRQAHDTDAHRSARLLLDWLVESQTGRLLAEHDEREIAWESTAVVHVPDGRQVPYQRTAIEIANAPNRVERIALDDARARLVERELAPMRQERLEREHAYVGGLGIAGTYNATFEALSGVDLAGLAADCERCLRDTQDMWDDVLPPALHSALGVGVRDATRADALALFRAPQFDGAFPAADLEPAVRRQMHEMGMDPVAAGRVRYDTGERAGKRARAFCAPVRIPDEVYLVMRPHGGQTDWQTFLHELGHALHFGYTRADYPFEYRWMGDNSVTEAYAMLFDHLVQTRGWLRQYTGLSRADLPKYLRAAALEELQFVRRYCAKLLYEVQLHGGSVSWDALPALYVETLSTATNFRYQPADAFVDVDSRYYAVRYLRAWQLGAVLAATLVDLFNEDWFRNPRAGPWIVGTLFAEGQRELAHELAARVSGRALSFTPVIRKIEGLLE